MLNLKKNIFNRKNLNYLLARVEQSSIPELQEKQEVINNWINYIQSRNINLQELKSKIDETDKKIDSMVYELYGLTEEEIKVLEG